MMKDLRRRYVYADTYAEVMAWAEKNEIRSPNRKSNFPFFLQEYLNSKGGDKHVERI